MTGFDVQLRHPDCDVSHLKNYFRVLQAPQFSCFWGFSSFGTPNDVEPYETIELCKVSRNSWTSEFVGGLMDRRIGEFGPIIFRNKFKRLDVKFPMVSPSEK